MGRQIHHMISSVPMPCLRDNAQEFLAASAGLATDGADCFAQGVRHALVYGHGGILSASAMAVLGRGPAVQDRDGSGMLVDSRL
jgi:hypothetical protein